MGDEKTPKNTSENTSRPNCGGGNKLEPAPLFEKGESGNPKGRPKGARDGLRAQLRRLLKSKAPPEAIAKLKAANVDCGEGTMGAAIMAVLSVKALSGDLGAIKEVVKQTTKPVPAVSLSAKVSKEEIEPYMDTEVANGDRQKDRSAKALSPNARDIAAALDRE